MSDSNHAIDLPMRSVLLTGGAGFIGSRLARRLAQGGVGRIWIYDNLHPQVHGPKAAPPCLPAACRFVRGDVRDARALATCVAEARPDAVVHLAAETGTGQSAELPELHREVNVAGTANLIGALRHAAPDLRRIVLPSSRAVYGEGRWRTRDGRIVVPPPRRVDDLAAGRFDPADDDGPLMPLPTDERSPVSPCSVYAETKLEQERLLTCADLAGCRTVVLRLQNVYGAGQSLRNPYTGIIPIFMQQARERGLLDVYEDGRVTRDFVFVDDVVDALARSLTVDLPSGSVINIGSGAGVTLIALARHLLAMLGLAQNAVEVSGRYRIGDVRHACADIAAAQHLLGWVPETGLQAGLAGFVAWAAS